MYRFLLKVRLLSLVDGAAGALNDLKALHTGPSYVIKFT